MMRKLFVMGGGGFAMEPENDLLDKHILSLSAKPQPKICFLGTATGDGDWYREKFYAAYRPLNCVPSHLSLFQPHTRDLEAFISEQDIIHVGGGNTECVSSRKSAQASRFSSRTAIEAKIPVRFLGV